nr:MAG TPA: hypothetical protein [Caudoviricetes sp.]
MIRVSDKNADTHRKISRPYAIAMNAQGIV